MMRERTVARVQWIDWQGGVPFSHRSLPTSRFAPPAARSRLLVVPTQSPWRRQPVPHRRPQLQLVVPSVPVLRHPVGSGLARIKATSVYIKGIAMRGADLRISSDRFTSGGYELNVSGGNHLNRWTSPTGGRASGLL